MDFEGQSLMRRGEITQWRIAIQNFDHQTPPTTGRFERWLARMLRRDPDPGFRFGCAYFAGGCDSAQVTSGLIITARNQGEHHIVRARCLESLSHKAGWHRPRTRQDRKVYKVVLDCLRDPHPNVRFWACYAAAGMHLLAAQSVLRGLGEDEGLGCMGWTVAYEAGEALKAIRDQPAWADDRPPGENPYPPLL